MLKGLKWLLRREKKYMYENIGEMYLRQKKIDAFIEEADMAIQSESSPESSTFALGKMSALTDYRDYKHKDIVEALVETKKSLENNEYYDSILDEIEYIKGYIKGLTILLTFDRETFDIPSNFVLFIFATSEELKIKYKLALSLNRKLDEFGSDSPLRYYISTSVDDICDKIMQLPDETTNAVCAVYQKDNSPAIEQLQQLAFEENDNVFLICDREEINVSKIIEKIIKTTSV